MRNSQGVTTIVQQPQFTTNLFRPLAEVAGKTLQCIERNVRGDCLCIVQAAPGSDPEYLIDVDHRDVAEYKPSATATDAWMATLFGAVAVAEVMRKRSEQRAERARQMAADPPSD